MNQIAKTLTFQKLVEKFQKSDSKSMNQNYELIQTKKYTVYCEEFKKYHICNYDWGALNPPLFASMFFKVKTFWKITASEK